MWTAHTNDIVKRVNLRLKHLSTFWCVLNEDLKKGLVNALVQLNFDYGDVVYFNTGLQNKERLQRAHNNCVRFIAGVRRQECISGFREKLGYVRLDLRRKMRYYTLIFKLFLTRLYSRFIFFSNVHSYRPCISNILLIPMHLSDLMTSSFTVTASELWERRRPISLETFGDFFGVFLFKFHFVITFYFHSSFQVFEVCSYAVDVTFDD
jgi:hypothetical protein